MGRVSFTVRAGCRGARMDLLTKDFLSAPDELSALDSGSEPVVNQDEAGAAILAATIAGAPVVKRPGSTGCGSCVSIAGIERMPAPTRNRGGLPKAVTARWAT